MNGPRLGKCSDLTRWATVSGSTKVLSNDYLKLEAVSRISPRTGQSGIFEYLNLPNWVNVIARTNDDAVVFVQQYRHGVDEIVTELPAGSVEHGEQPGNAAARELLEETGYVGDAPSCLGSILPNPAIQNNILSTWLVTSAERISRPIPDAYEHIEVVTVPISAITDFIRSGHIRNALTIAAIHLFFMG